ncbi:MAG: sensor histidine kinase [Chitinophagaceae bacterium]|nr:sensor histidine kinase [Chitinophagaceae bacterium]
MKYVLLVLIVFSTSVQAGPLADSFLLQLKKKPIAQQGEELIPFATSIQNRDYANCLVLCSYLDSIGLKQNNLHWQAESALLKGLTNYFAGEYEQTLQYYLNAISLFEKGKNPSGKARVLNELGIFYRRQKNDSAAARSLKESYQLATQANDRGVMATSLNNQGILKQDFGYHQEAITLFAQAKTIYQQIGDSIGISYTDDYTATSLAALGQINEALRKQENSYALRLRLNDSNAAAISLMCLAEYSYAAKRFTEAQNYLKRCMDLTQKIGYKDLLAVSYQMQSKLFAQAGNYNEAYRHQVLFTTLNDSIFNEKRSRQISDLQTRYETEKKQQQIVLLTKENQIKAQRNRNLMILFCSFLGILFLSALLYRNYQKRKKQRQEDARLLHEKDQRNRAIIEAEEKERLRIARELHDGIAQTMTAARMQLEHFSEQAPELFQNTAALQTTYHLIQEAAQEVRSVSHSMIPNALLKSGLLAAVRDFINRTSSHRLKINLVTHGLQERLPQNMEHVVFRVLQELVNNILKHAQANEVTIQLIREGTEFTLMVEDNGQGFDVATVMDKGIGLKNIESRISYLHGQVHFDSRPGRGTTVIIEIPISETA